MCTQGLNGSNMEISRKREANASTPSLRWSVLDFPSCRHWCLPSVPCPEEILIKTWQGICRIISSIEWSLELAFLLSAHESVGLVVIHSPTRTLHCWFTIIPDTWIHTKQVSCCYTDPLSRFSLTEIAASFKLGLTTLTWASLKVLWRSSWCSQGSSFLGHQSVLLRSQHVLR